MVIGRDDLNGSLFFFFLLLTHLYSLVIHVQVTFKNFFPLVCVFAFMLCYLFSCVLGQELPQCCQRCHLKPSKGFELYFHSECLS